MGGSLPTLAGCVFAMVPSDWFNKELNGQEVGGERIGGISREGGGRGEGI